MLLRILRGRAERHKFQRSIIFQVPRALPCPPECLVVALFHLLRGVGLDSGGGTPSACRPIAVVTAAAAAVLPLLVEAKGAHVLLGRRTVGGGAAAPELLQNGKKCEVFILVNRLSQVEGVLLLRKVPANHVVGTIRKRAEMYVPSSRTSVAPQRAFYAADREQNAGG